MSYEIGDTLRLTATFTDGDDAAADPTTITLEILAPDGTKTTLTYAAADVTKSATGVYYYDLALDAAQTWEWRWIGTGTVAQADQGSLWVMPQNT